MNVSPRPKKPWFKKPAPETSKRMKLVKSSGTRLERAMEDLLLGLELEYERQPRLVGQPDFRIKDTNILIFCDSSFWHGRRAKEISGKAFRKNVKFWTTKLLETRKRDVRTNRILRKEGWHVIRFWDTEVLNSPEKVIKKLLKELNKNVRQKTHGN